MDDKNDLLGDSRMLEKYGTMDMRCKLEDVEGSLLNFYTPANITHTCKYVEGKDICQYGGFCEFRVPFVAKK